MFPLNALDVSEMLMVTFPVSLQTPNLNVISVYLPIAKRGLIPAIHGQWVEPFFLVKPMTYCGWKKSCTSE